MAQRCANGEDLKYLACCAVSGDFNGLLSGLILPDHMSDHGAVVAQWVLDYKQDLDKHWPPSYSTLRYHFREQDGFVWPDSLPETVDPNLVAYEVLSDAQMHLSVHAFGTIQSLVAGGIWTENRAELIQQTQAVLDSLRNLTTPRKRTGALGSDRQEVMDAIHGTLSAFTHLDIIPEVDEFMSPYSAGLYTLYARPGSMKSMFLLLMACQLAFGPEEARVLLVDPENEKSVQLTRLTAMLSNANLTHLLAHGKKRAKAAKGKAVDVTLEEMEAVRRAESVVDFLVETKRIGFVGKDDIAEGKEGVTVAQVMDAARKFGAQILFVDQAHTLRVDGMGKNASRDERIMAVATVLSNSPEFLAFATTQQNRNSEFKASSGALPEPTGAEAYGGDGLYQKSTGMAHMMSLELDDGSSLLILTPVKARNSRKGGRIYLRIRPFDIVQFLSPAEGALLAESVLAKKRVEAATLKKAVRGKNAADSEAGPQESRHDLPVPSPRAGTVGSKLAQLRRTPASQ